MKIAIVGMAFRFPGGVYSEKSFWDVLKQGRDVVGSIDEDRWSTDTYYHPRPAEPGRSLTLSAGLLDRVDGFDAAFFGISPREARKMDPQHRLVLELTWEALENGGQLPERLAGSDCAVYLGISSNDYGLRSLDDLSSVDAYSMTGNTLSIAANRISYAFDLRGPSMALDTACSSSLVALHQACGSLQTGESSLAIAGGVNLLLHPHPFIGFSSASMLSARGKCRAFDASGDGYVRAEGGAILLLKPLQQAQADGDAIEAVILATGANSDGADKSGITIPSPAGQASLLRSTLKRSGLTPDDIDYVEAHGTGTAVGDPIEASAIGEVLGVTRTNG
ncbi:MAG: type I polyketide synthase WcbR, partial [Xanthomonadales bacterium]|nr:type I polyketide synthase WcbR [Xanthomonadales bacterium]